MSAAVADSNRGRPRDRDRTRQAIVAAARRLAANEGNAKLTLSGVAAEAGFATGTVYGYFRTKQELLQSVFAEEAPAAIASGRERTSNRKQEIRKTAVTTLDSRLVKEPGSSPFQPETAKQLKAEQSAAVAQDTPASEHISQPFDAKALQTCFAPKDQTALEHNRAERPAKSAIPEQTLGMRAPMRRVQTNSAAATGAAKTTIRHIQDSVIGADAETGIAEQPKTTLPKPDAERATLDAIIDRLVVPPMKPAGTPATVSRFERRVDLLESELAKLSSQQTVLGQQYGEFVSASENKAASFAARLDAGEQRRLQAVSELRGELLDLSLRVKALESEKAGAVDPVLSSPLTIAESGEAAEPVFMEFREDVEQVSSLKDEVGKPQSYLNIARQSANNAVPAHSGYNETGRDIRRYLLLGGVAIVALVAAVIALSQKPSPMAGSVPPARHAARTLAHRTIAAAFKPKSAAVTRMAPVAVSGQKSAALNSPAEAGLANSADTAAAPNAMPAHTASRIAPAPLDQLSRMAQAGNPDAQLVVGLQYLNDAASPENRTRAKHWLELASAKGLPVAQYRLGTIYQHGLAGPADPAKAMHWYKAAAAHGNVKAMYNLAFGNAEGWDGPKNYSEAARWYTAAARLGYVDAQFNLAVLYERGQGVPQSLLDAYKWYSAAAQQGDSGAAKRVEIIATQLSGSELSAGRQAIAVLHPQQPSKTANTAPSLAEFLATHG